MGRLTKKRTGAFYLTNLLLTVVLFVVLYLLIDGKVLTGRYTTLITLVCVNVILAVSLNLVTGILGQLVLGHAGFMLVGAYASALFTKNVGMALPISFPISLVLAGLLAALFGVIIGIPALRLRGDYLAIITLGFGEIIRVLANADFLKPITNGAMGLGDIPTLYNRRTSPAGLFVYAFIIMVLVIVINFSFGRSRHGRAALRQPNPGYRSRQVRFQPLGGNPHHGGARRHGFHHRLDYFRHGADRAAGNAARL